MNIAVAEAIEKAHQDNTSIIRYNDENSLSCVLSLAYYTAQKDYAGEIILVAVNYDKKTKKHECRIEKWEERMSNGLVTMTHPESPNHRGQRYCLTNNGRKEIECLGDKQVSTIESLD